MMMRKFQTARYNVSGVQTPADGWMHVRSHVTLPDAEAGGGWIQGREPFHATEVRRISRQRSFTVPFNGAALFLCLLFVAFGAAALSKAVKKAEITKNIVSMEESIDTTLRDNAELTLEVAAARDSAHISYLAVQNLGMIDSKTVEAVPVVAPETRPAKTAQTTQVHSSFYDARDGMISGSR